MGAYLEAKKISAMLGTKVGGGYFQGKKVLISSIPVGTVLWSEGKAFVNGSETYVGSDTPSYVIRNGLITLSQPITKLKNGLQFNFETTKCVYYLDLDYSGGWFFDDQHTFSDWGVHVPATGTIAVSNLQAGKVTEITTISARAGSSATISIKQIDVTHLQISTSDQGLVNSTAGDSGSGQTWWAYIKSITAY